MDIVRLRQSKNNLKLLNCYRTPVQTFCRNEYNLTGLCSRHSCPLANARYATVREQQGVCYLFLKTIERAHLPAQMWEKIKLPKNYSQALALIDEHLEFWAKFQRHKCKQRLTKLHQMLVRKRKLKISAMHTQETYEVINKRYEKRETKREAKALIAAKLETAIEKELLNRLQAGTYKGIYNLQQEDFNKELDDQEIVEEEFQVDESEEDDDSLIGADFGEDGEDEMHELTESEIRELEEEAEKEGLQMEDEDSASEDEKPILKKRSKPVSLSYEYEFEREDGGNKKVAEKSKESKRRAVSKSTANSGDSLDF